MDQIIDSIKKSEYFWNEAHRIYWNDKSFIIEIFKFRLQASYLYYISEELKKNEELFLNIIRIKAKYIKYVHKDLLNNKEFIIKCVKNNVHSLEYIPEKFKNDMDVVIKAVQNGDALYYLPKIYKNDKNIVLKAIKNNPKSLAYASENLQNNKKLILMSLKNIRFVDYKKFKLNRNKFRSSVIYLDFSIQSFGSVLKFF